MNITVQNSLPFLLELLPTEATLETDRQWGSCLLVRTQDFTRLRQNDLPARREDTYIQADKVLRTPLTLLLSSNQSSLVYCSNL